MRERYLLGLTVLLLGLLAACAPGTDEPDGVPGQVETPVWINELHYDNVGDDVGEAVELAGVAGTDLTGWTLERYNGEGGTVYGSNDLSGALPDQQDGFGTVAIEFPPNGLQNGSPDALALVDATGGVVQFLSYEGTFEGANGAAAGLTSTDIGVAEGPSTPAGTSLQLTGTGEAAADFTWTDSAEASFGQVNAGQTFGESGESGGDGNPNIGQCGDPATPIHAIQGTGATFDSAFGGTQTVEGVVTASFEGLSGFYVQEEAEDVDASPETSEGIFVFVDAAPEVTVGNVFRVTGTVAEFENSGTSQTQLTEPTDVTNCGAGTLPEPLELTLPFDSVDGLEAFEGMLVTFPQALTIAEYFNYDRFGEIVLALPLAEQMLPFQPTAVADPGTAEADAIADYVESARITLDDGRSSQNPPPRHPNGDPFTLDNTFRGGDTVANATGVLDHTFGRYRVQPTTGADYTRLNPRPETPDEVGGGLNVATFNVLNLFNGDGMGGGFPAPRGADDEDEYLRQQAKIVAALRLIDADIVGLVEIENDAAGDAGALDDLVEALNAAGGDAYAYIDTGVIGTDEIRVALIYKPDAVTPVGDFAVLDSSVDERFIDTKNRPVLAQTFEDRGMDARLTVAVNHLKSKGSECGAGDDDPVQGNCNLTRTLAAEALADWLAADPTGSGDPDFLIIGDLNAYDKEDPIDAVRQGPDDTPGTADDYTDLSLAFEGELAYSYVFNGQFGYLDYALSSATLTPQVTGATTWHINSPEPDLLDYDTSFNAPEFYAPTPYRSSDHDPVVVGLELE